MWINSRTTPYSRAFFLGRFLVSVGIGDDSRSCSHLKKLCASQFSFAHDCDYFLSPLILFLLGTWIASYIGIVQLDEYLQCRIFLGN
jgi:hypothetical protein